MSCSNVYGWRRLSGSHSSHNQCWTVALKWPQIVVGSQSHLEAMVGVRCGELERESSAADAGTEERGEVGGGLEGTRINKESNAKRAKRKMCPPVTITKAKQSLNSGHTTTQMVGVSECKSSLGAVSQVQRRRMSTKRSTTLQHKTQRRLYTTAEPKSQRKGRPKPHQMHTPVTELQAYTQHTRQIRIYAKCIS